MMARIREFIYLDIEKLYSLYSQVFEGVADQILQSYEDEMQATDTQRREPNLEASDIETRIVEVSRRTENRFLLDHMYNKLEAKLESAITDVGGVNQNNYQDIIGNSFIIKATGTAEIEDFDRIKELFEQYNFLGEAMYYVSTFDRDSAREFEKIVDKQRYQIEMTKDKNKQSVAEKRLEKALIDHKQKLSDNALAAGMGFDRMFLTYMAELTERYYPDRLDITITPQSEDKLVSFRGVIDKKWLRQSPEFLRHLYSGLASGWTIIGPITHVPDQSSNADDKEDSKNDSDENKNMRSAYNNLIKAYYGLEKHFTTNASRIELIVSPLAIYREVDIGDN